MNIEYEFIYSLSIEIKILSRIIEEQIILINYVINLQIFIF